MKTTSKDEVEGYFNLKTSADTFIYTLFYTNICEFSGDSEGILDEGMYQKNILKYTLLVGRLIK